MIIDAVCYQPLLVETLIVKYSISPIQHRNYTTLIIVECFVGP